MKKIKLELSVRELIDLANAIHDAQYGEVDFVKVKDRKIRKLFSEAHKRRHNLWKKIIRLSEK